MAVQFRYADQCMISSGTKETAYDTLQSTYTAPSYYTLQEYTLAIDYADSGRPPGQGSGVEFGLDQYIVRKDIRMTLTFDQLRPNDAGWMSAYALGTTAAAQDGAVTAYTHTNTLATASQLPSFTILASEAGEMNQFTGCVINTLTISSDGEGYLQGTAEIIASGRRATNAQTYPATVTEAPFQSNATRIWQEVGAATDIQTFDTTGGTATLVVGTPSLVLSSRVYGGWTLTVNNNLRESQGYWATNSDDQYCRGQLERAAQREVTIELAGVSFEDDSFEDWFLGAGGASEHMAVEINCWGESQGVIAGGGAIYPQIAIVCPRMYLDPVGASGDDEGYITQDIKYTMLNPTAADEGSAVPITIYVNTIAAAFAA